MESAGETILSVPPLLHLLAIQQQQQQQQQKQNGAGNTVDMMDSAGGAEMSSSNEENRQQQQRQMLIVLKQEEQQQHNNGTTDAAGADGSGGALASDEEDRGEEKRTKQQHEEAEEGLEEDDDEGEQHHRQGKLEIVEESTTPPPLFCAQTMQFGSTNDELMMMADVKMEPPKDLQIQIPPLHNAFTGHCTPTMAQSAATTPTEQQASKSLPVIKPPGDEKEERPSLSYKDLIIEAIESSPERRLKLSEIYQVIKYLHPYYQRRADQWGWQNSIRHNLSLHDCFVKLPLKQTSANGVVGHFWTVVTRGPDEKPLGPTRRRTRGTGKAKKGMAASMAHSGAQNGGKATNLSAGTKNGTIKGLKGRQSVSSDSGVMSDEGGACSHSNSPTELGTRSVPLLLHANAESAAASLFHFHRPTVHTPTHQMQQQHVQAVHSPLPTSTGSVPFHQQQQQQQFPQNLTPLELVLQLQHHQQQQQQHHHLQTVQQQQPFAAPQLQQQFSPLPKMLLGADEAATNAPAAAATPTLIGPNDAISGGANAIANSSAFLPCELQQLLAIAALSQQQHQLGAVAAAQHHHHHQQQQQQPVVTVSTANSTNSNTTTTNNNGSNGIAFQSPPPADSSAMTLLQLLNTAGTSGAGGTPTDASGLGLLSHLATAQQQLAAPTARGSPAPIGGPQMATNSSASNLLASATAAATAELQRLHMIQLYAQQQQQQLQQQLAALLEQQQQQLQFQQREATTIPAAPPSSSSSSSALSDVLSLAAGCHDQSALVAQLLLSRLMHSPAATSTSSSNSCSSGSAFEQQQQQMQNGHQLNNDSSPPPSALQHNNNNSNNNLAVTAQHLMDLQRAALLLDQQQQYQQVQAQQTELSNKSDVQAVPQQQQQSMDIDVKQEMDQQQELSVV